MSLTKVHGFLCGCLYGKIRKKTVTSDSSPEPFTDCPDAESRQTSQKRRRTPEQEENPCRKMELRKGQKPDPHEKQGDKGKDQAPSERRCSAQKPFEKKHGYERKVQQQKLMPCRDVQGQLSKGASENDGIDGKSQKAEYQQKCIAFLLNLFHGKHLLFFIIM